MTTHATTILRIERSACARQPDGSLSLPKPLSDHQTRKAWVLLGDPGAGKTKTFEALAAQEGGEYLKVSDFLELSRPAGYRSPLFIDGLDEATAQGGQLPLGRIRQKLSTLAAQVPPGMPAFRISCREADWRGSVDSDAVQKLVGENDFAELHLQPLDDAQILQFAAHWLQCDDAAAQTFVTAARARDLGGLLTNPQTLRMLIEAVGNTPNPDDWPQSKQAIYENACAKLVRDQNEDHLAAQHNTALSDKTLLRAAGYLYAVMLLSGSAALALQPQKSPAPHVLEVTTLITDTTHSTGPTPSLEACRAALHTNLFTATGNLFTPLHRTVAEYLGATYLAERLRAGLPASRLLTLLQAEDGGVVPELRGLHAWLAVVADSEVRSTLIDHDALGLIIHGDVGAFSVAEKERLLAALQKEAQRYEHFRSQHWASQPFGALASVDMEDIFSAWLQSPERTPVHQAVLDCILDALQHGQTMPTLAEALERLVRDKSYWPRLRHSALKTLCNYAQRSEDYTLLERLLEDVHQGRMEDSDNELLGVLLQALYPKVVRAQDLWKYYKPSLRSVTRYSWFWYSLVSRYAPREDIPLLADALVASGIRLRSRVGQYDLSKLIGDLLREAIIQFGEHCTVEQVYAWLKLGIGEYNQNCLPNDTQAELKQWFETHPDIYKRIVEYGLTRFQTTEQLNDFWFEKMASFLYHARAPSDAVDWYLTLAEPRTDALRQTLLSESFHLYMQREGSPAALERITHWTQAHPEDAQWISERWLACPYPPDEDNLRWINREVEHKKEKAQEQTEEQAFMREALPKLVSDQAHLDLLEHIGQTYLNFFHSANGKTPQERLLETLHGDPHWVEMALAGLRYCLRDRADTPSLADILNLYLEKHRYTIAIPWLAAMQLRYDEDAATAFDLPVVVLEKLVAFRLSNNFGTTPEWFLALIAREPDLVARVMLQLMSAQIAANANHVDGLYALAYDSCYAPLASKIAPTLIQALPARATKAQLGTVRELISCLLLTLAAPQQKALIAAKLAQPKMDVAQRVYWLTAGLQVAPELYLEDMKTYLGRNQLRAAHAYELLQEQWQEKYPKQVYINNYTLASKTYFIELLGTRFTPAEEPKSEKAYVVTPAMESMRYVQGLIASLSTDPSEEAQRNLNALLENPSLQPWKSQLKQALYEQHTARRKACFRHASAEEVCNTLANLQPANVADLHALVVDHLRQLAHRIRHGNTNDYGQYWRGDTPKIENDCRDALLSDLKMQLQPLGINAESEGQYADSKRADIKVIYQQWQFPIEIKRNSHKDLWIAIKDQLIDKYSRELSSSGYGVYLVFWFNHQAMPPAGDGGNKPKTPKELQERLTATIPQELRQKIAVLVMDCAQPSLRADSAHS